MAGTEAEPVTFHVTVLNDNGSVRFWYRYALLEDLASAFVLSVTVPPSTNVPDPVVVENTATPVLTSSGITIPATVV